jgi:TRAP-type C4-dicarboxylate transport system permease large subunit
VIPSLLDDHLINTLHHHLLNHTFLTRFRELLVILVVVLLLLLVLGHFLDTANSASCCHSRLVQNSRQRIARSSRNRKSG